MKILSLLIFISFCTVNMYSQNAWTKKKGEAYIQASFNTISDYDRLFNKDGEDIQLDRKVTDNTIQLYGEYGITDKTTVLGSVPIKLLKTGEAQVSSPMNQEGDLNTLGNVTLGVRHLLYDKKFNVTTQLNVDINSSDYDENTGLRSGFDSWMFTPTISVGKGWDKFYVQAFTGLGFQTNNYSNYFKIGTEFGYKFFNRVWLIGFVDIFDSLDDGNIETLPTNAQTGLFVNNQQYSAYGFKVIGEINEDLGLTFASGGAFDGHLEAKTPSLNFGIYYKLK